MNPQSPPGPELELARLMLARETGGHETPAGLIAATNRILLQLHGQLAHWLGRDGAHAVFARALDRSRGGHAVLAAARIDPLGDYPLAAPVERLGDNDPAEVRDAVTALLAAVLALLTRLIGPDLVARLLRQVWPDDTNTMPMPDEDAPSD